MHEKSSEGFLSFLRRGKSSTASSSTTSEEEATSNQGHPLMEAGLGRRYTRANIESFLGRLQSTLQKSLSMAGVLQPSPRIEKTEGSRTREEERIRAASQVTRLTKQPGFKHYTEMMRSIEGDAYYNLRSPAQLKKDELSLDYTVGFYAGVLSVIDDFFYIEQHAEKVLAKENKRIKEEQSTNEE